MFDIFPEKTACPSLFRFLGDFSGGQAVILVLTRGHDPLLGFTNTIRDYLNVEKQSFTDRLYLKPGNFRMIKENTAE